MPYTPIFTDIQMILFCRINIIMAVTSKNCGLIAPEVIIIIQEVEMIIFPKYQPGTGVVSKKFTLGKIINQFSM